MTTDPTIENLTAGGQQDGPCTVVRLYGNECKVSGERDGWPVEAPFAYNGACGVWARTDSRDAALVLAGEYLRESRDHSDY
jgi:hypothetical protein